MLRTAYVSRLGGVLRTRGLSVSELHRRLAAGGTRVSRTALDRVVSDRPVTAAYLPVLLPVLELLQVSVQDAFEAVNAPRAEERRRVRATATRLLRPPWPGWMTLPALIRRRRFGWR